MKQCDSSAYLVGVPPRVPDHNTYTNTELSKTPGLGNHWMLRCRQQDANDVPIIMARGSTVESGGYRINYTQLIDPLQRLCRDINLRLL